MKRFPVIVACLLIPLVAAAQPVPPAPALASSTPAASTPDPGQLPALRLGGELAILPMGSLEASIAGQSASADTQTTFAIGGVLQHPLNPIFTVDFAPRVVLNVKGNGDAASATEIDLRVRLTAGGDVAPGVRLYAALEPGFSLVSLPDNSDGSSVSPNGPTLGLATGAAFRVAPGTTVTAELGYQFGFQSADVLGMTAELHSRFLHIAGGVLFDL
jgi:hypothetical protein